jgi:phosphatidylserine/phosphatidylglycerophosphate/cardiolipin synthase-like enzyme
VKKAFIPLSLILVLLFIHPSAYPAEITLNNAPTQVCFNPNGGCTDAIIKQIDSAKSEILEQAYSFTSSPINKALVQAHKRGVRVEAILDKSQGSEKYTSATFLANSGIPTFIDARHAIAHNKIMIIDKETVITGSFNFTKAAEEKNAENLIIIKSNARGGRATRSIWYGTECFQICPLKKAYDALFGAEKDDLARIFTAPVFLDL